MFGDTANWMNTNNKHTLIRFGVIIYDILFKQPTLFCVWRCVCKSSRGQQTATTRTGCWWCLVWGETQCHWMRARPTGSRSSHIACKARAHTHIHTRTAIIFHLGKNHLHLVKAEVSSPIRAIMCEHHGIAAVNLQSKWQLYGRRSLPVKWMSWTDKGNLWITPPLHIDHCSSTGMCQGVVTLCV